jgi:FtsP/CotA-like multicopper oxidase with cupredoxin domain
MNEPGARSFLMSTFNHLRSLATLAIAGSLLLGAQSARAAAIAVDLTAIESSKMMPDGVVVPMWCFTHKTTAAGDCTAAAWTPGPTIRATTDDTLQITLANNLRIPTWPAGGEGVFTVPAQAGRVSSFVPQVAAGGTAQVYSWTRLKAGTYLYATGARPSLQQPMGLYGVLIVTDGATGNAYAGRSTDADAVYLFSEVDPVQNAAVQAAALAGTDINKPITDAT